MGQVFTKRIQIEKGKMKIRKFGSENNYNLLYT